MDDGPLGHQEGKPLSGHQVALDFEWALDRPLRLQGQFGQAATFHWEPQISGWKLPEHACGKRISWLI